MEAVASTVEAREAPSARRPTGAGDAGLLALLAVIGLAVSGEVRAQTSDELHGVPGGGEDRQVVTHHAISLGDDSLRYTARAGRLPIRDSRTGERLAGMFFVSYTRDPEPGEGPRPLTFLWNGGPGSSSSLVHLVGFGPKRIEGAGSARPNRGTWLEASDLVFVDPVGTGYSRPSGPEHGSQFYQNPGDARSVAEFIRLYRKRAGARDAPVFLAGESFGVRRAVRVAHVLRERGVEVAGLVLLGLNPSLADLEPAVETALRVPTYAATAFHHGRLSPELQGDLEETLRRAETWALEEFAPALAADELPDDERRRIRRRLAEFIGVDPGAIDSTLTIGMDRYTRRLLRDEGLVVGRYDSRITGPLDTTRTQYDPTRDPSLEDVVDDGSVIRYLRSELGYRSDLRYQGPFGGGFPAPESPRGDWMSVRWDWSAEGAWVEEGPPLLQRVLAADRDLRVYVACGHYDLVCPYARNERMASRLPDRLRPAVETRAYGGGHAIYTDSTARIRMSRDVAEFIEATVAERPAAALEPGEESSTSRFEVDPYGAVTSRHAIELDGEELDYTARAGLIPVPSNETGEPRGHVFFTAYTVDPDPEGSPRPLTFVWNGGPGANSVLTHFVGFGPKRFEPLAGGTDADGVRLVDNQETWLDRTDLVFVDPVGTGYGRPTKTEYAEEFYSTLGDIASVTEVVRVYLTRYDAWEAPLFLAGESYGSWRAAGVAEELEYGDIPVAGVMLISGGIPVGRIVSDPMRAALFVPTRTAAAFHHERLVPELQADLDATLERAEAWARSEYAPALERPDTLDGDQRRAVIEGLARFTGLEPDEIDRETLVVQRQTFAERLLADRNLVLERFDTRRTTPADDSAGEPDGAPRARTVLDYFRSELGYRTDLAYQGLERGFVPTTDSGPPPSVGERWNWNQNMPAEGDTAAADPGRLRRLVYDGPPRGSEPWLLRAVERNPSLRAFVAAGLYDSLNSCAFNEFRVTRLEPDVADNLTLACYSGGHVMYEDEDDRVRLKRDVSAFIAETVGGGG